MTARHSLLSKLLLLIWLFPHEVHAESAGWRWYKSCLQTRPLLTKSSTSAVVMTVSDVLCQRLERSRMHGVVNDRVQNNKCIRGGSTSSTLRISNDWRRTWHVAITGFTLSGPSSHTWYAILEAAVKIQHRQLRVAARLVLDAFVFSPVAIAAYFVWRAALEGTGPKGIAAKLKARWSGALVASWAFWPLANIVLFGFVPIEMRVLHKSLLSLLWTGYLSHANSGEDKK